MSETTKKIAYIFDEILKNECDRIPVVQNRASLVHNLITSYGLLSEKNVEVIESEIISDDDLLKFHSSDFVEFLKKAESYDTENLDELDSEAEEFGLTYDCPLIENILHFSRCIIGGSVTAANLIIKNKCDVAVNFFGGWHHAQRDMSEGFCYVNDIVFAIQTLTNKFKRVMYVDLDVHHGNGVENAFEYSKRILTLSFHKLEPGFYPGSGSLDDIGVSNGKFYSVNVPFKSGIGDEAYSMLFSGIFKPVFDAFQPEVLVVQCGGDILANDLVGGCNVTPIVMGKCLKIILDLDLPVLILGGGGYNLPNTARYWTYLMSIIVGKDLPNDIPDECQDFTTYVPTFELQIEAGNQQDYNTREDIERVINTVLNYCKEIEKIGDFF